ncbi:LamG-like jellyroll fold domain-containing protein [Streptomyces sp. NPDC004267]|uniref:LamG-like jellyroll fold domain-containing protein n=1 Tax=Streptomyces sp. NPDC004267 TaxID=3364694 RepID=UPI00369D8B8A
MTTALTTVLATVLATVVLLGAQATPAAAVTTVPGDAAGTAPVRESVRAMTWNMCGEAGGRIASDAGYCPYRNVPGKKIEGIARLVQEQDLNVVMLQEVCSTSHLAPLEAKLEADDPGSDWTFALAGVTRPGDAYQAEKPGVEFVDTQGSKCRGSLSGTLGVAIGVKGRMTWKTETDFTTPLGLSMDRGTVLCVEVAGWENHVCTTHVSNFGADVPAKLTQAQADQYYDDQIATIAAVVGKFPSVVLGGDFNTRLQDRLQPLYSLMSECDQRTYVPGEASNEVTKFTLDGVTTDPDGGIVSYAGYTTSKIDYLFATDGFTGCDSRTDFADQADYRVSVQPTCTGSTPVTVTNPCTPSATGYSDHTPLYGRTQGAAKLSWRLDGGPGATTGGSGGYAGTLTGGASWAPGEHGGALALDGSSGAVTAAGPAVDTAHSFTVSAWAKVNPGAGTGVVLSQDGTTISGTMLFYNAGDSTWRFALPKADSATWSVDQAIAPATAGTWTRLTGVYDAAAGTVSLYVDGTKKATATHADADRWAATGPFVVGRDRVKGANNAYFNGFVQRAAAFDYPLRDDQIAAYAGKLTAPTGRNTALRDAPGEPLSQGCHQDVDPFGADYGTATSLTPTLTATVTHPDPSKEVWAEFSIWDNTDPAQPQPITMGETGSASAKVRGQGTVSVPVPQLLPGHEYGWRVRATDGTTTSPISTNCHFKAPAA